jgi:hypothetical protein
MNCKSAAANGIVISEYPIQNLLLETSVDMMDKSGPLITLLRLDAIILDDGEFSTLILRQCLLRTSGHIK